MGFGLGFGDTVNLAGSQGDVLQDIEMREQIEGLEYGANLRAHLIGVYSNGGYVLAIEQDLAIINSLKQIDSSQESRFSRATRTNKYLHFMLRQGD